MRTRSQYDGILRHWKRAIKSIQKKGDKRGFNTRDEYQQIYWIEAQIEKENEEWKQSLKQINI